MSSGRETVPRPVGGEYVPESNKNRAYTKTSGKRILDGKSVDV